MRNILIALFVAFFVSCNSSEEPSRPNIILIITDDQGYGDLGCNGNPHIQTPALDQFSQEAVSFSNFHVSTTCAPTRGSLMTGRHTNRVNVFHTISGRSILWEDEVILSQVLGENGYRCGMFGKWHLGDNYPYRPEDRGFHEVVRHGGGGVGQMPDYWGNDYFDDTYWHNGEPEAYKGYCTDVFFEEAMRFIEDSKEEPFFCYLSTNAPHGPLNVPEKYIDLYETNSQVPPTQKRFYGMITNIDDNFANLMDQLDRLGLTENTIVIFMTDNGTAYGGGLYNAGMRGTKGSEYDGGHRVPFMVRWPGGEIGGGAAVNKLVAHYDLLPTLVDLLGLRFAPTKPLDGTSFTSLLRGDTAAWADRILYMDTQRLQNLVKYRKYSVMQQNWRLVNGTELYNIGEDPGQQKNIIEEHPEMATRLAEGYETWWSSIMEEKVNERYAYILAGTEEENPLRLSSHDLHTGRLGRAWHQNGAATAVPGSGIWKVEISRPGTYRISLRRFPRESQLGINALFPEGEKSRRLERVMPASKPMDFHSAWLYIADFSETREISENAEEVTFTMDLPEGRFDMEALLLDKHGVTYPSYYVYIEKI